MSQENVEIVQRFFEASDRATEAYWRNPRSIADSMKAGDLDPEAEELWALVHPEAVWNTGPFGIYRGRLEIAAAWDDIYDIADDYRTSLRELVDCGGDRVFVCVDRTIKAKGSGIHTTIPIFAVVTVQGGLLVAGDEYATRAEALEAAGLSE